MPSSHEIRPAEETSPAPPRPTLETLVGRGLRLTCPRCGEGPLYRTYTRMHEKCPQCQFVYNRAPGYYLGATYINYGITALSMTAMFLTCRLVFEFPIKEIIWPAFAYSLILPMLLFKHARAMWLALDCHFDSSVLSNDGAD